MERETVSADAGPDNGRTRTITPPEGPAPDPNEADATTSGDAPETKGDESRASGDAPDAEYAGRVGDADSAGQAESGASGHTHTTGANVTETDMPEGTGAPEAEAPANPPAPETTEGADDGDDTSDGAHGARGEISGVADDAEGAASDGLHDAVGETFGRANGVESAASVEADDAEGDVADGGEGEDAGEGASGGGRPWGRWLREPVVLAVVVALVGAGLWARAAQVRGGSAAENTALTDAERTEVVIGDVSNSLGQIFSYSYTDVSVTEQAARDALAGRAYGQYQALFAQVRQRAAAQRLTLSTRVVRAGVVRMSGDTAQLLVFLDQTVHRKDKPGGTTAAAQLSVTARLSDGHWRIVDIQAR